MSMALGLIGGTGLYAFPGLEHATRVEIDTPYGGRAVSWEPLGAAWLKLGARRRREKIIGRPLEAACP